VLTRYADRILHLHEVPARDAVVEPWPEWVDPRVRTAFAAQGVTHLWAHQAEALAHVHAGRHVVVSTGTASGKSLTYQVPALDALVRGRAGDAIRGHRAPTALYLAPTKALAADQLRRLPRDEDGAPLVRATTVDGDSSLDERSWARDHAQLVLTNPDTVHHTLLPGHERWARLFAGLRIVVVDECHHYRGVFGAHVAHVLRRLLRVCAHHGSQPVVVLSSATVSEPEASARRLTGLDVVAVTDDASPHGPRTIALWEPPLVGAAHPSQPPSRRSAGREAADVLTDLVLDRTRTLVFSRSRRGAESIARGAQERLGEVAPELPARVATYRGGYLPEERRALEDRLRSGDLLGLAATNALELGVDVSGLDAEPIDTFLVHHPDAWLGAPVEATVFDPDNPYVLGPHLAAAAQELPLTEADLALFGPRAREGVDALEAAGWLRRRTAGWFWTRRDRAAALADLRGSGGAPVQIVDGPTGRLVGTVDAGSADGEVHEGAVYVHQGQVHVVDEYDVEEGVAVVHAEDPGWSTSARSTTEVSIVSTRRTRRWGATTVHLGEVDVTSQVVSFSRRRHDGSLVGEEPLDLPSRTLRTVATWWTLPPDVVERVLERTDVPGAAHAAEHAAIGLLPLLATCDRWDLGGLSTAVHADTGTLTIFVHDGHPGGAGFAERGYEVVERWLRVTRATIDDCECRDGCPSCVVSPKCGNFNEPLDKAGAVRLLDALLDGAPDA
jgi:DEAD/DEAH box helicase domain-containing protein